MFKQKDSEAIRCSFCGKTAKIVGRLIAGPGVYICTECVELCYEIIEKEYIALEKKISYKTLPKPKEIVEILNQYVVGQEFAKKAMAVAVYNHYKRINASRKIDDVEIQKSNMLLLGPTGSGKTYLAQTLAKILDVPIAITDATTLTEAGYVGEDVENILLRLIQVADYDIKKAEKGIIYIDEIDKIGRKFENPSITRDVSGEGVQQALLRILEGTIVNVPPQGGRKHPHQTFLQIDTTNILFICGGAFEGLDNIVSARINTSSLGFRATVKTKEKRSDYLKEVMPEDLIKFGIIPEFVGRVPIIVPFDSLGEEELMKILVEPKNALLKQYQKMFQLDGLELEFTPQAVTAIAKEAKKRKTGARALRAILEEVMLDIMYEVPSKKGIKKVIINQEVVINKQAPLLIFEDSISEIQASA